MFRFAQLSVMVALGCLLAAPVQAQGPEPPVSQLLAEMVRRAAELDVGITGDHSQHFVPATLSIPALEGLNRALALQVASFPFGPTDAGLVTVPGRNGDSLVSFGTSYTGLARTMGRGQRGFAMSYQGTTFESIDDINLRASDVNLYLEHICCSGDESERDLLQQTVSIRLHRKVYGFSVSYGLTNRFDVGVMVPFVEVAADARVTSFILRTATDATPGIHEFDIIDLGNRTIPNGAIPPAADVSGTGASTARGFGDVRLRGKYSLLQSGNAAVAVAVDLRLPTGDADEFIGLGATQVRPSLIWSLETGRFVGRGRVEYAWSNGNLSSLLGGGDLSVPNELLYAVGVDAAVAPRTTFVVDIVGRQLPDVSSFDTASVVFPNRGPGPLPSADYLAVDQLTQGGTRTVNLIVGAIGARFHIMDGVFANARVIFPVGSAGLRPATTAILGLDYGF